MEVLCYVFAGNEWTEAAANWSNVNPNSMSTLLSYQTISYNYGIEQPTAHTYAFDITAAVDGWRTGACDPEKGIIFVTPYGGEPQIENGHKTFGSFNHWAYKPTLTMTYETRNNLFTEEAYYLNNRYWGEYLRYTSSTVTAQAGLISYLGSSIRWEIGVIDGGYVIRSQADPTKYLAVPLDRSSDEVIIEALGSSVIPNRCIWTITTVGGCLIKSKYNSKYLYHDGASIWTSANIGAADSDSYNMHIWRLADTSYYGNTPNSLHRELEYGFSVEPFVVNIGESSVPVINTVSANTMWASPSDFVYECRFYSEPIVYFDYATASGLGECRGISTYVATHKVTGQTFAFQVYVEYYLYELVYLFGFQSDIALLVRDLYDRIDEEYYWETDVYKAWATSRLLSSFFYDGGKWDQVAGQFVPEGNRWIYFVNTLGYTRNEYESIKAAIVDQHNDANTLPVSDFAHMQYSLAARLAYVINEAGILGATGEIFLDDDISYLAGWLGDAVLADSGTTIFKNDDYMADLDAENMFRKINNGMAAIDAINTYYDELTSTRNRAAIFLGHIPYDYVQEKVFYYLIDAALKTQRDASFVNGDMDHYLQCCALLESEQYHWDTLRTQYPDSYNFLLSLQDGLANIATYHE